jgi:hypothetical protein
MSAAAEFFDEGWPPMATISEVFCSASTETNAFFYALTNLTGTQEE